MKYPASGLRIYRIAFYLGLALLGITGCDSDSTSLPDAEFGSIKGTLSDTRNGTMISEAIVTLVGSGKSDTTDSMGQFDFSNITPGLYRMVAKKQNFGFGLSEDFTIKKGEKVILNSQLRPLTGDYDISYSGVYGGKPTSGQHTLTLLEDLTWIMESFPVLQGTWTLTDDQIDIQDKSPGLPVYRFKGTVTDKLSGSFMLNDTTVGTWSAIRN